MLVTNDNESISVWFFSVRLSYGDLDRRSLTSRSAATFRARYKAMPVASILQRSACPLRISRLPVATSKSTFSRRTLSLTLRSVEVRCIVRHGLHSDGPDNDVVSIIDYGKCMHQLSKVNSRAVRTQLVTLPPSHRRAQASVTTTTCSAQEVTTTTHTLRSSPCVYLARRLPSSSKHLPTGRDTAPRACSVLLG